MRISLLASGRTGASAITAKSVSLKDVTTAVSSAVDGDTVVIPGGTATWTSGLAINKAITLQGNGIGNTIIKDGLTTATPLITFTLVFGKPSRLTGIEFQEGASTALNAVLGFVGQNQLNGQTMRINHCNSMAWHVYCYFTVIIFYDVSKWI